MTACETFDEYLQLAQSSTVLSAGGMGDAMADAFSARFGMRRVTWHPTYALNEVDARYRELAAALDAAGEMRGEAAGEVAGAAWSVMAPVLAPARTAAKAAVHRALAVVGDRPIAVDSSATFVPYNLAHELLDYGFNVQACFAFHMKGGDADAAQRLREDYPGVRIVNESADEALREGMLAPSSGAPAGEAGATNCGELPDNSRVRSQGRAFGEAGASSESWLAIGTDAAFFTGARHVVDIYHDEGYFGYQGIERLMNELADAGKGGA